VVVLFPVMEVVVMVMVHSRWRRLVQRGRGR